ncbi:hypothetical protein DL240_01140 [Lujinxingia litoralis]|uniref:Uncharacterized protein n=1 Tax=Lujinxingia litoralis TaxID=2211119 RepID=A0A328C8S1_9DELT|nr:hypothetical protein DL240_01140 [Lujinxingia litoralis]
MMLMIWTAYRLAEALENHADGGRGVVVAIKPRVGRMRVPERRSLYQGVQPRIEGDTEHVESTPAASLAAFK